MIRNDTLDEIRKPERNRAIRRKNNYAKAKKFKEEMIQDGFDWWEDAPLGRFVKNTSLNEIRLFSGYKKTKNKGPNHRNTYAPTHNYKHSDLKKIQSMKEDWADYCEDAA